MEIRERERKERKKEERKKEECSWENFLARRWRKTRLEAALVLSEHSLTSSSLSHSFSVSLSLSFSLTHSLSHSLTLSSFSSVHNFMPWNISMLLSRLISGWEDSNTRMVLLSLILSLSLSCPLVYDNRRERERKKEKRERGSKSWYWMDESVLEGSCWGEKENFLSSLHSVHETWIVKRKKKQLLLSFSFFLTFSFTIFLSLYVQKRENVWDKQHVQHQYLSSSKHFLSVRQKVYQKEKERVRVRERERKREEELSSNNGTRRREENCPLFWQKWDSHTQNSLTLTITRKKKERKK